MKKSLQVQCLLALMIFFVYLNSYAMPGMEFKSSGYVPVYTCLVDGTGKPSSHPTELILWAKGNRKQVEPDLPIVITISDRNFEILEFYNTGATIAKGNWGGNTDILAYSITAANPVSESHVIAKLILSGEPRNGYFVDGYGGTFIPESPSKIPTLTVFSCDFSTSGSYVEKSGIIAMPEPPTAEERRLMRDFVRGGGGWHTRGLHD